MDYNNKICKKYTMKEYIHIAKKIVRIFKTQ